MKLAHEPWHLLLFDDKTEVQVIGSLRHEVDFLLLEDFERRCDARQDRANFPTDQADGGTVSNNRDPAVWFEVLYQSRFRVLR